ATNEYSALLRLPRRRAGSCCAAEEWRRDYCSPTRAGAQLLLLDPRFCCSRPRRGKGKIGRQYFFGKRTRLIKTWSSYSKED
ncbi:hypothetical protein BRADI_4g14265v3, partial [Brachypodium distachyon]